jgi:hypothetical protein
MSIGRRQVGELRTVCGGRNVCLPNLWRGVELKRAVNRLSKAQIYAISQVVSGDAAGEADTLIFRREVTLLIASPGHKNFSMTWYESKIVPVEIDN